MALDESVAQIILYEVLHELINKSICAFFILNGCHYLWTTNVRNIQSYRLVICLSSSLIS